MKEKLRNLMLQQLDSVLENSKQMHCLGEYMDESLYYSVEDAATIITSAVAVVRRVAGAGSVYEQQMSNLTTDAYNRSSPQSLMGVLQALRNDVAAGYLDSLVEIVHAELFTDFMDMASHLHEEGYKDAAAVIAGSVLENHIRQLCVKQGVDVEATASSGAIVPKKADVMNADLVKAGAYSKLDQKNVTAWLDLRNRAAHGRYPEYTSEQVGLFIQSVRDFITRNPA